MNYVNHEILDIAKVNIISWGTIGVTQAGATDWIGLAENAQILGTTGIIMFTLGYTIVKFYRLIINVKWEKEDRTNNN